MPDPWPVLDSVEPVICGGIFPPLSNDIHPVYLLHLVPELFHFESSLPDGGALEIALAAFSSRVPDPWPVLDLTELAFF